jgi:hypothetical protein
MGVRLGGGVLTNVAVMALFAFPRKPRLVFGVFRAPVIAAGGREICCEGGCRWRLGFSRGGRGAC